MNQNLYNVYIYKVTVYASHANICNSTVNEVYFKHGFLFSFPFFALV